MAIPTEISPDVQGRSKRERKVSQQILARICKGKLATLSACRRPRTACVSEDHDRVEEKWQERKRESIQKVQQE